MSKCTKGPRVRLLNTPDAGSSPYALSGASATVPWPFSERAPQRKQDLPDACAAPVPGRSHTTGAVVSMTDGSAPKFVSGNVEEQARADRQRTRTAARSHDPASPLPPSAMRIPLETKRGSKVPAGAMCELPESRRL